MRDDERARTEQVEKSSWGYIVSALGRGSEVERSTRTGVMLVAPLALLP